MWASWINLGENSWKTNTKNIITLSAAWSNTDRATISNRTWRGSFLCSVIRKGSITEAQVTITAPACLWISQTWSMIGGVSSSEPGGSRIPEAERVVLPDLNKQSKKITNKNRQKDEALPIEKWIKGASIRTGEGERPCASSSTLWDPEKKQQEQSKFYRLKTSKKSLKLERRRSKGSQGLGRGPWPRDCERIGRSPQAPSSSSLPEYHLQPWFLERKKKSWKRRYNKARGLWCKKYVDKLSSTWAH